MIRITENVFTKETLKEGTDALSVGEIFFYEGRHYAVAEGGGSTRIYLDGELEAENRWVGPTVDEWLETKYQERLPKN